MIHVPAKLRPVVSRMRAAVLKRRRLILQTLSLLLAVAMAAMAVTGSRAALLAALILVIAILAGTVIEVRRLQISFRKQSGGADARKRVHAGGTSSDTARLRALQTRVAELEHVQSLLFGLLYKHAVAPGKLSVRDLPAELVPAAARALLDRGDALDAHDLLVGTKSLYAMDKPGLRKLRNELRRRGYLTKALEVSHACVKLGGEAHDVSAHASIKGEIAVLSGDFVPSVSVEKEDFRPCPGRILHLVGNSLPEKQSGYTLRTHYIALAQRAAGLDPHVATQMGFEHDGEDYAQIDVDGITYHRIPGPRRGTVPLDVWLKRHVEGIANLVRIVRPAVLHAASDFINAQTAEIVGKEFGIPVVYESRGFWEETWLSRQAKTFGWGDLKRLESVHGLPDVYRWRREIEDRCRKNADHVVTLADVMADRIVAGGVARERVTVVPNGVDVKAFPVLSRNATLAAELGISEETTVIGYISSIVEYEGIDTLISAYAKLKVSAPGPVRLLIVGDGAEREPLMRQAEALGLDDALFVGAVPHDRVLDYYSLIDIFVVPRRPVEVCHLVTPLKPFEAFSTGRTVVLSNVRALAEIAQKSGAAELFEAGNADSLAEVLLTLLKDPQRRQDLAAAGAAWVRVAHTWATNADTYIALYEQLGAIPRRETSSEQAGPIDLELLRSSLPHQKLFSVESVTSRHHPEDTDLTIGDGIRFSSRPFVCGAIGHWDPAVLQRLRNAAPAGVRNIYSGRLATLWATPGVDEWRAGSSQGFYWSPLAAGPVPDSWRSAAEGRLAAGLVLEQEAAVLHTCALGLQELYVRKLGDALYFAVRIDPLLELDGGPVHADPAALGSLLALGCPVGAATPFLEVRRAVAATAWRAQDDLLDDLSFEPSWLAAEPVSPPSPDEIAELVAAQIPDDARLSVPLSGGWDSRLLAALARKKLRDAFTAWTVGTDDGVELDLRLAGAVADALGVEHHMIVPGADAWQENRQQVRARVQYQTWRHTWLMPMARVLHNRGDVLLDGLAGDVLLKGSGYVDHQIIAMGRGVDQRVAFLRRLCGNRLGRNVFLAPSVAKWIEDTVRTDFLRATSHCEGHPDPLSLSQLITRTSRSIAAAPTWLFGPEAGVQLPFIHPDVINAALRVPYVRKIGGGFYREVLRRACGPAIADLPSTHDPGQRVPPVERSQTSTAALAAMATAISSDQEVSALLAPQLISALTDPAARARLARSSTAMVTMQWADLLVEWRQRYGSRLIWPEFC